MLYFIIAIFSDAFAAVQIKPHRRLNSSLGRFLNNFPFYFARTTRKFIPNRENISHGDETNTLDHSDC